MRSNRLKIYAASGVVLAALGAGSYGIVTLSSGTTAATHVAPSGVTPPITATAPNSLPSAVPSMLRPPAPPVASTPPVVSPPPPSTTTTTPPTPPPPPVVQQQSPATSGIPQGGGGDGDPDNSGAPSDGDGNV